MGNNAGQLALGIAGAAIAGPLYAGIGFTLGSALGAVLFAPDIPDGPDKVGPRVGDTSVQSSSLGKVKAEHYGVTRSAGNMIWSAGIKETTTTKEVLQEVESGGKGGGNKTSSSDLTEYTYSCSFAMAFGRGPAREVIRVWADSKIIYDASSSNISDDYKFRFIRGTRNQKPDPLIAESVNRRLAALPDVNEGTQVQLQYSDISTVIAGLNENGDDRSSIYATKLQEKATAAQATGANIPDYGFTPAYRDLCYIVFDDIELEKFGNRIPNITAEIVWGESSEIVGVLTDTLDPEKIEENKIAPELAIQPKPLQGLDPTRRRFYVANGNTINVFKESANTVQTTAELHPTINDFQVLGVSRRGTILVKKTGGSGEFSHNVWALSSTSLGRVGQYSAETERLGFAMNAILGDVIDAIPLGDGTTNRDLMVLRNTRGEFHVVDLSTPQITHFWGKIASSTRSGSPELDAELTALGLDTGAFRGHGHPSVRTMCTGGITKGLAYFFFSEDTSSRSEYQVYSYAFKFDSYKSPSSAFNNRLFSGRVGGPESANVEAQTLLFAEEDRSAFEHRNITWDPASDAVYVGFSTGTKSKIVKFVHKNRDVVQTEGVLGTFDFEIDQNFEQEDSSERSDFEREWEANFDGDLPAVNSGSSLSKFRERRMLYAVGRDIVSVTADTGIVERVTNVLSANVNTTGQVYLTSRDEIIAFVGNDLTRITRETISADEFYGDTELKDVIKSICQRAGLDDDQYSVTGISDDHIIRGYTVGRAVTGRTAIQPLLQAYFCDGIETDWQIKFFDRQTETVATVDERDLGSVSGETGQVAFYENRLPEYSLPAEINLSYIDTDRNYQPGVAQRRRPNNPISVMDSRETRTFELAMSLSEAEARDIAQKMLFAAWQARDNGKARLPWRYAALDPSDVIQINFDNGRVLKERLGKVDFGANWELEVTTNRDGDPVYTSAPQAAISSSSVPTRVPRTLVDSYPFVLDMPLLYDFHDQNRTAVTFYTAVGADDVTWRAASIYRSISGGPSTFYSSHQVPATWGAVVGAVPVPRSLWTTDRDNTLTVRLSIDYGQLTSVSREQVLNERANRAVLHNPVTGVNEIIAFQDVQINADGSYTLSNLSRGLRGTDWAVAEHGNDVQFIYLPSSAYVTQTDDLSNVGTEQDFKAVSPGQLVGQAVATRENMGADSLKPYAPSRVNRSVVSGALEITWNRRSRLNGEWNMAGTGIETVPLNEDSEQYECYLLGAGDTLDSFDPTQSDTFSIKVQPGQPVTSFTATELTNAGYVNGVEDTVKVAIYQVSAQVGRGFPRLMSLAP